MSIDGPPPFLETVLFVMVGEHFPKGDEDKMRALGALWKQLVKDLEPLDGQLDKVAKSLAQAGYGPAISKAQDFIDKLNSNNGSAFAQLREAMAAVGGSSRKVGNDIEHAKWMIISFAAMLASTLASYMVLNFFSAGAASAGAAAAIRSAQEVARQVLIRLGIAVAFGAAFMGGLDLGLQLLQIVLGKKELNEIDWKRVGLMAGLGALGGVFGWALFGLKGGFGTVFRNAVSEGGVELVAEKLQHGGALTDDGKTSVAGGAMSGAVEGAAEHGKGRANSLGGYTTNQFLLALGKLLGLNVHLGAPPPIDSPSPIAPPSQSPSDSPPPKEDKTTEKDSESSGESPKAPGGINGGGGSRGAGQSVLVPTPSSMDTAFAESLLDDAVQTDVEAGEFNTVETETPPPSETFRSFFPERDTSFAFDESRLDIRPQLETALLDPKQTALRDELFTQHRKQSLTEIDHLLGQHLPLDGKSLDLRIAAAKHWQSLAAEQFDNAFGRLIVPLDVLSLDPLAPTSTQDLVGMGETWQGFVTQLKSALARNGADYQVLLGFSAVHLAATARVQEAADNLRNSTPDGPLGTFTALQLITMRDAVVARARQTYLDQLGPGQPDVKDVIASLDRSIATGELFQQVQVEMAALTAARDQLDYLPAETATPRTPAAAQLAATAPLATAVPLVATAPLAATAPLVADAPLAASMLDTVAAGAASAVAVPVSLSGLVETTTNGHKYLRSVHDGPDALAVAEALPAFGNHLAVAAHGTVVDGQLRVGDALLTPQQFAAMVRSWPDWQQRPLILVVCGAAAQAKDGSPSFAAQLRAALGVEVIAAAGDVSTTAAGEVLVAATSVTASGRIVVTPAGEADAGWLRLPQQLDSAAVPLGPELLKVLGIAAEPGSSADQRTMRWAGRGEAVGDQTTRPDSQWRRDLRKLEGTADRRKDTRTWKKRWSREFGERAQAAGYTVTNVGASEDAFFEMLVKSGSPQLKKILGRQPTVPLIRDFVADKLRKASSAVIAAELGIQQVADSSSRSDLEQFASSLGLTATNDLRKVISKPGTWDNAAGRRIMQATALALGLPMTSIDAGTRINYAIRTPMELNPGAGTPAFRFFTPSKKVKSSLGQVMRETSASLYPDLKTWMGQPEQADLDTDGFSSAIGENDDLVIEEIEEREEEVLVRNHHGANLSETVDSTGPVVPVETTGNGHKYLPSIQDEPDALAVVETLPRFGDHLAIAAHGVVVGGQIRVGDDLLTPQQFAAMVRTWPDWQQRPVILVVCRAGATVTDGSAPFAAQVRDALGVEVVAAAGNVYTSASGDVLIMATSMTASGRPTLVTLGKATGWQQFPKERGSEPRPLGADLFIGMVELGQTLAKSAPLTPGAQFRAVEWVHGPTITSKAMVLGSELALEGSAVGIGPASQLATSHDNSGNVSILENAESAEVAATQELTPEQLAQRQADWARHLQTLRVAPQRADDVHSWEQRWNQEAGVRAAVAGYSVTRPDSGADSFFEGLIGLYPQALESILGDAPTVSTVRAHIAERLRRADATARTFERENGGDPDWTSRSPLEQFAGRLGAAETTSLTTVISQPGGWSNAATQRILQASALALGLPLTVVQGGVTVDYSVSEPMPLTADTEQPGFDFLAPPRRSAIPLEQVMLETTAAVQPELTAWMTASGQQGLSRYTPGVLAQIPVSVPIDLLGTDQDVIEEAEPAAGQGNFIISGSDDAANLSEVLRAESMMPVLAMQVNWLGGQGEEKAQAQTLLGELRGLIEQAHADQTMPTAPQARRLATATPEQLEQWHAAGLDAAVRVPATLPPTQRHRIRLLFGGYGVWTGAAGLRPDAPLSNQDFLPLVQAVLDPAMRTVTDADLATVDRLIDTLVERQLAVTVPKLRWLAAGETTLGRYEQVSGLAAANQAPAALARTLIAEAIAAVGNPDVALSGLDHPQRRAEIAAAVEVTGGRGRFGWTGQERVASLLTIAHQSGAFRHGGASPMVGDLRVVDRLIKHAVRHHRKHHRGALPREPLSNVHLQALVRAKFGPQAPANWDSLVRLDEHLTGRERPARRVLRMLGTPWRDSVVRVRPDDSLSPVNRGRRMFKQAAAWQERRWQRLGGGLDSPAARQAEFEAIVAALAGADLGNVPAVSAQDIASLVYLRRKLFADGRYRQFDGLTAYRQMGLKTLGVTSAIGAVELARMARIAGDLLAHRPSLLGAVVAVPGTIRRALTDELGPIEPVTTLPGREGEIVLPARLTGMIRRARHVHTSLGQLWADQQRSLAGSLHKATVASWRNPDVELPAAQPVNLHARALTAWNTVDLAGSAIPDQLTEVINGVIPSDAESITREQVQLIIASKFAQLSDEGVTVRVEHSSGVFDIKLRAHAASEPYVELDGERLRLVDAKLEDRKNRFGGQQITFGNGVQYMAEGSVLYRAPVVETGVGGGGLRGHTESQLHAALTAQYQQLRAKGATAYAQVPVNWTIEVQHESGQWREFEIPQGGDAVRVSMADFLAPLTAQQHGSSMLNPKSAIADLDYRQERQVSEHTNFPLWDMDFAVSKMELADQVLTTVRDAVGWRTYLKFKPLLEAKLSNDQLALGFKDIIRPDGTFQDGFAVDVKDGNKFIRVVVRPGNGAPITTVTKASAMSVNGETRFDRVDAAVSYTGTVKERAKGFKVSHSLAVRMTNRLLELATRNSLTKRHATQWIRTHRSWLTRALRVGGNIQEVSASFDVDVEVIHGEEGAAVAESSTAVAGFVRALVPQASLPENLGWLLTAHASSDSAANPSQWFTPGRGYGLSMDYLKELGGVRELYNTAVDRLVQDGYLPAAARADAAAESGAGVAETAAVTSWDLLQQMPKSGSALYAPAGASPAEVTRFQNWRQLIEQVSHRELRARADDVFGGDAHRPHDEGRTADSPGIVLTFSHPDGAGRQVSMSLSAAANGPSEYMGRTNYRIQFGHTGIDVVTRKRVNAVNRESAVGMAFRKVVRVGVDRLSKKDRSRRLGETKSVAVSADTDGQNMDSSLYQVPIKWHLRLDEGSVNLVDEWNITSTASILQPDTLQGGEWSNPLPPAIPAAPVNTQAESILARMHGGIYTVLSAEGVDALRDATRAQAGTRFSREEIAAGLSRSAYQSEVMRAMAGGATLPLGRTETSLKVVPVGRPQIMKVWLPYSQQVLESQLGREQSTDHSIQSGLQINLGAKVGETPGLDVGMSTQDLDGTGLGTSTLDTQGNYRGVFQDTYMAVVRTKVINKVMIPGVGTVEVPGEVLLNVLASEVAQARSQFDDPTGALTGNLLPASVKDNYDKLLETNPERPHEKPERRGLDTEIDAPVSLQEGQSWTAMWPMLYESGESNVGMGPAMASLDRMAEQVAGPSAAGLQAALAAVPGWLSPIMSTLNDGGNRLEVNVDGDRYDLVMQAQHLGPPRDGRPSGTGLKAYMRAVTFQERADRSIHTEGASGNATVNVGLPDEAGLSVTATVGESDKDTTSTSSATNLLHMEGVRLSHMVDFTQSVRFSMTLRKIGGPQAAETADTDLVVMVPKEATIAKGVLPPAYPLKLGSLPAGTRVEGVHGVARMHAAVLNTDIADTIDAAESSPSDGRLDTNTLGSRLSEMLSPQGAAFSSIAIGGQTLDAGDGQILVRATFGDVRQVHYLRKAEMETYDHASDIAKETHAADHRTTISGTLKGSAGFGGGVGGSRDTTATKTNERQLLGEGRKWRRSDSSVYSLYADLQFEIVVVRGGRQRVVRTVGSTELIMERADAVSFGIPNDVLDLAKLRSDRVFAPPKPGQPALPEVMLTTPAKPQHPGGKMTPGLQSILDKRDELVRLLETLPAPDRTIPFFQSPMPRPQQPETPEPRPVPGFWAGPSAWSIFPTRGAGKQG